MENNIRQNWLQLTAIQIGGAICLPVIMIGQMLAKNYGFVNAMFAVFIGNLLLMFLGIIASNMSVKTRLSTIENARRFFGIKGTKLFAIIMVFSLIGWFAIQLNLMSLSVINILTIALNTKINVIYINIMLGALITLLALNGIQALDKLAKISMPLLIFTMGYAIYLASSGSNLISGSTNTTSILGGISLVIATSIAVVSDLPTYFRFARSKKDGFISIGLLFLLAVPIIEFVGIYIGCCVPGKTIVDVLTANGGILWQLWVGFFLLLAGWTTNNTNLYSSAISLQIITPKFSEVLRILIIGTFGTILASFDILKNFEAILDFMGIMIISMSTIILMNFVLNKSEISLKPNFFSNLLCWIFASSFGVLSFFKILSLTEIPIIDSWIIATTTSIIIFLLSKKFTRE